MTVHNVSSASQLAAALEVASGGDRIKLAPGDYGDVDFDNMDFSSAVTITSADPSNMASFNTIGIYESSNLTFDGIEVDFEPTADTLDFSSGVKASYSQNITFRNSDFSGGDAVNGIPADSPSSELGEFGIDGYPVGRALTAHYVDNLTIEDNDFSDFKSGISFAHVDGMIVHGNSFSGMRTTQIAGGHLDNADISGNNFADITPWISPTGGGDHGDFIHIWTTDTQEGPNLNISITDNFFKEGEAGGKILGIYIEDNNKGKGYDNLVLEDNVIHNGNSQGFSIENATDVTIRNNTLLQSGGEVNNAPGIHLTAGTNNVLIENNVTASIYGPAWQDATALNIVARDNLFVQSQNPDHDGYTDGLFLNPLVSNSDISDLLVLPGSAAEGVGAAMTQYQPSDGAVAGIVSENQDGFEMLRVNVSAKLFYGSSSDLDLENADITWDFGDGTTASGESATHAYLAPGTYDITAQIQASDGATAVLHKTVEVETPYALEVDFEGGYEDLTYISNDITTEDDPELVATELGTSVHLTNEDSVVKIADNDEIFDNKAFSISLNFSTTAGSENDGMLIYFSANVYARFNDGELSVQGITDEGESFHLTSDGANLNDNEWHQMIYTFDQGEGTAKLYLDGAEVDQISNIEGAQKAGIGQDFYLGNPFGGSFTGLVDNLSFVRDAMSPDQIEQEFQSFQAELSDEGTGPLEQITSTAPPETTGSQGTQKELAELQDKIAAKQAFANGPQETEEPTDEDNNPIIGEDADHQSMLQKVFSLLVGLFGNSPSELEEQFFTSSQTAGVSASGDEDDLYTLIPPTGHCDEIGMEEDCDYADPLALTG